MGIENMTPQWRTGWRSSGQDRRQLREVLQIRNRGEAPCGHVADLIDERITDVDQRIDDLTKLRRDLVSLAGEAKRLDPTEDPQKASVGSSRNDTTHNSPLGVLAEAAAWLAS